MEPNKVSYSLKEALAASGLNRSALYRAMAANDIQTFKVGRRRMISAKALLAFIEKKERESAVGGVAA